MYTCGSGA
jgi:hypothetical protein